MGHWIIVDTQTGLQVGNPYKDRKRCATRVDKLDNDYGAYRYRKQQINTETTKESK